MLRFLLATGLSVVLAPIGAILGTLAGARATGSLARWRPGVVFSISHGAGARGVFFRAMHLACRTLGAFVFAGVGFLLLAERPPVWFPLLPLAILVLWDAQQIRFRRRAVAFGAAPSEAIPMAQRQLVIGASMGLAAAAAFLAMS
jgi:hypothetical protein